MIPEDHRSAPPGELLVEIIRQVRRRWRLKIALRGVAAVFAVGLFALLASAYGLEHLRFSPTAIVSFRIVMSLLVAGLVLFFLVLPLRRRVTDQQVAMYVEEHEPSLQAAIISAVEQASESRLQAADGLQASPALVGRLIESAVEKCQAFDAARGLDRPALRRYGAVLATAVIVALAVWIFGPAYLRQGASALLRLSQNVQAASPYRIDVKPGNATVPRGSDQTITARMMGFEADQAELLVRRAAGTPFERVPLLRSTDAATYEAMLFDVPGPIDYFVQASGVRSPVYTLNVVDLPYVQRLQLEYRFPAHTGLAPQTVANGGDIVVPRGTEVRVRAFPTIPSPGGRVVINESTPMALTRENDGSLTTAFVVDKEGFYRVELEGAHGERVPASPQYTIDVLADQSPTVSFVKPGRDTKASPVEEVFVQARAEDDFGVKDLQLVYSVNGGSERTLKLFTAAGQPRRDVSAGHTFYLEELDVEPGDFVSYYARATDNDRVQGPKSVTSDLYFMQIRPFNKEFKPATSQAGAGQGGGGGQVGALSQQQRQIIAATFNVVRDRRSYTTEKLRENVVLLALSQTRLREQVDELVQRLNTRLEPGSGFDKIAELLPKAVLEMRAAESRLQAQDPAAALAPEQRALQFLQKAEEEYELQVSMTRNGGGGGGGSQDDAMAEDLADLFELELDKLANQYETTERAGLQGANQQLDELMERLKELARRQEQEAERQRRRASAGQAGQGGGSSQRALADQAEEAARRLERLSREESRPDLMDAARRLRDAADAMRRAAANGDPNGAAQAGAAVDRLREAGDRLERGRTARGARDVRDALERAEELTRDQQDIAGQVQDLAQAGGDKAERVKRLTERKDSLAAKVEALEKQIDRTANDIRGDERDAARKLQEAAGSIRDNKIKEKIRYSKGVMQGEAAEYAKAFEEEIGSNLEALRNTIGEAAAALGKSSNDRMARTLEKARELSRDMDSLDQRMRERADPNSPEGSQGTGQKGSQGSSGAASAGQNQGQGGRGQGANRGETADGRGGDGDTVGPWSPGGGGGGSRRPGRYTGEEIRQFRGEVRQRSADAQDLRRDLKGQGLDAADLDEILRGLRALDNDRVYTDVAELERLRTQVTEGLKRFEYALRRRAAADEQQLFLSSSDEVPAGFRPLVEEYYRSLSKRPK